MAFAGSECVGDGNGSAGNGLNFKGLQIADSLMTPCGLFDGPPELFRAAQVKGRQFPSQSRGDLLVRVR